MGIGGRNKIGTAHTPTSAKAKGQNSVAGSSKGLMEGETLEQFVVKEPIPSSSSESSESD